MPPAKKAAKSTNDFGNVFGSGSSKSAPPANNKKTAASDMGDWGAAFGVIEKSEAAYEARKVLYARGPRRVRAQQNGGYRAIIVDAKPHRLTEHAIRPDGAGDWKGEVHRTCRKENCGVCASNLWGNTPYDAVIFTIVHTHTREGGSSEFKPAAYERKSGPDKGKWVYNPIELLVLKAHGLKPFMFALQKFAQRQKVDMRNLNVAGLQFEANRTTGDKSPQTGDNFDFQDGYIKGKLTDAAVYKALKHTEPIKVVDYAKVLAPMTPEEEATFLKAIATEGVGDSHPSSTGADEDVPF